MNDINNDQKDWKEQVSEDTEKTVNSCHNGNTPLSGFSTVSEFVARAAKMGNRDLVLEQYMNSERGSCPDIDLDHEFPRESLSGYIALYNALNEAKLNE